jgi:hypothetical protein
MRTILRIESAEVLHIPWVRDPLTVAPPELICRWADDFCDDKRSFQRGGQLVHAIGLLDTP